MPLTLGFEKLFIGEGEQCLFVVSSANVNPMLLVISWRIFGSGLAWRTPRLERLKPGIKP